MFMKEEFNYEPITEEEKRIKEYILQCEEDDYDRLIQICDAVATDYVFRHGNCLLDLINFIIVQDECRKMN